MGGEKYKQSRIKTSSSVKNRSFREPCKLKDLQFSNFADIHYHYYVRNDVAANRDIYLQSMVDLF